MPLFQGPLKNWGSKEIGAPSLHSPPFPRCLLTQAETWATGSGPVQHLVWPDKLFTVWQMRPFIFSFCFLVSSYMSFLAPHCPQPRHRHLLASFIVLIPAPLGETRKGSLPALSQNELHSGAKRAAAAVAQPTPHAPKIPGKYFSCGVPSRLAVFLPTVSPPRCCRVS